MKIDLSALKQLREETQISLEKCKKALEEAGGDLEKAKEILKKEGIKIAEKKKQKEIIKIAMELAEKTQEYLSIQEATNTQKSRIESEIGFMTRELNELIFDIYGLDEKERILIQSFVYKKR